MTSSDTPGPGRNVATLRKARGINQASLARQAGVSVSLLSKIEVGDRTLSQGVAASVAKAMGLTLDEVLGTANVGQADEANLADLRSTIRRFDLPGEPPPEPHTQNRDLADVVRLRGKADLSGVLDRLPGLLAGATNHAHSVGSPEAWAIVADAYSAAYWLAARHRWMDLAQLAVVRQQLAAQRATPLATAIAARDEAGAFLNSGDFSGGLAVVDRAIVAAESTTAGREQALAVGILRLRGLTLAGRMGDRNEAERHIAAAWTMAEEFTEDIDVHGITFGPENTATHVVATAVDLENHRDALDVADQLTRHPTSLPATRVGPLHMNVARAKLALHDRDGALDSLVAAWDAAPQMAKVHPMSQELMRVMVMLHRRSNPTLTKLAKRAGIGI